MSSVTFKASRDGSRMEQHPYLEGNDKLEVAFQSKERKTLLSVSDH